MIGIRSYVKYNNTMNGRTMKIFVARTFHNVDGTELICTHVLLASSRTSKLFFAKCGIHMSFSSIIHSTDNWELIASASLLFGEKALSICFQISIITFSFSSALIMYFIYFIKTLWGAACCCCCSCSCCSWFQSFLSFFLAPP